jgi:hypothetical protein
VHVHLRMCRKALHACNPHRGLARVSVQPAQGACTRNSGVTSIPIVRLRGGMCVCARARVVHVLMGERRGERGAPIQALATRVEDLPHSAAPCIAEGQMKRVRIYEHGRSPSRRSVLKGLLVPPPWCCVSSHRRHHERGHESGRLQTGRVDGQNRRADAKECHAPLE